MDLRRSVESDRRFDLRARGFTLLELMITLVLVAVLAAISAPAIGRILQRADARSTARTVANKLRVARDHAMSRGQVVLIEVNSQTGSSDQFGELIMHRTTNVALHCGEVDTSDTAQVGEVMHVEELSDDIEIKQAPEWLCFSPDGTVLDQTGALLTSSCPAASEMIWLGDVDESVVGNPLTDCSATRDAALSDDRYIASVWGIEVPYNGSIRVFQ